MAWKNQWKKQAGNAAAETVTETCPACTSAVDAQAENCPQCGADLTYYRQQREGEDAKESSV